MTTPKYDLDTTDYGTTGWDLILQGLAEDTDNFLHTRILATLGENISAYQPVYQHTDGKYYLSKALAGKVPCKGIAIESGNTDDTIRIARMGPLITTETFTIGAEIYVGADGSLSEIRPRQFAQRIGKAYTANNLWVWVQELSPIHYGPTSPPTPTDYLDGTIYFQYDATTTTSTTSTTSSTTSSSTTSSTTTSSSTTSSSTTSTTSSTTTSSSTTTTTV